MTINDFLEKWGRTLFEAPLATVATSRTSRRNWPRSAWRVLDAGPREELPLRAAAKCSRTTCCASSSAASRRAATPIFAGRFFRQYLEQEVRNAPARRRLPLPREPAGGGGPGRRAAAARRAWLMVEAASQQTARRLRPRGWWCAKGPRTSPSCGSTKPRINIGRVVDVYRAEGLFRRNDLAFAAETEINAIGLARARAHPATTARPASTASSTTAGISAARAPANAASGSSATA